MNINLKINTKDARVEVDMGRVGGMSEELELTK